ncbi:protein RISC-INTERACTING CLEARING 3'-5' EXORIBONUCLEASE 1-like [Cornus florida]|uniref:protein RISC-INTERACTING CLEARING 3'-5' EXORIBONUCLEASE 1-like n=1 Tax=Cornus florida TaxID=4283 RepID=UPI00289AFF0D|nr:protein RISC-INTERACTING CLEARING 3'-5' EXORIBONUCLEASE 1-like [Cornus florida]XP_059665701.1 protein RISC-INTERACTING CLEARING 3'-5' EXORIBONUCLEASE 1-like [Cornus florida]
MKMINFLMGDGKVVETTLIDEAKLKRRCLNSDDSDEQYEEDEHQYYDSDEEDEYPSYQSDEAKLKRGLDRLWACLMREGNQKIVGFDLQWRNLGDILKSKLHLVLCTNVTCVIIDSKYLGYEILKNFLALKDVTFVGIHIGDDLVRLKNLHGIVFRNVVDISEHAANIFERPRYKSCSLSELADEVSGLELKEKPASVAYHNLSKECAAIDAYALFTIGKKLLGRVMGALKY